LIAIDFINQSRSPSFQSAFAEISANRRVWEVADHDFTLKIVERFFRKMHEQSALGRFGKTIEIRASLLKNEMMTPGNSHATDAEQSDQQDCLPQCPREDD